MILGMPFNQNDFKNKEEVIVMDLTIVSEGHVFCMDNVDEHDFLTYTVTADNITTPGTIRAAVYMSRPFMDRLSDLLSMGQEVPLKVNRAFVSFDRRLNGILTAECITADGGCDEYVMDVAFSGDLLLTIIFQDEHIANFFRNT